MCHRFDSVYVQLMFHNKICTICVICPKSFRLLGRRSSRAYLVLQEQNIRPWDQVHKGGCSILVGPSIAYIFMLGIWLYSYRVNQYLRYSVIGCCCMRALMEIIIGYVQDDTYHENKSQVRLHFNIPCPR